MHPTITIDLLGLVAAYAAEHAGAMLSGLRRRVRDRGLGDGPGGLGRRAGPDGVTGSVVVETTLDNLRSDDVRFLEEAAALGPLHVRIPSDALVTERTGTPPAFPAAERLFLAESIRWVASAEIVDAVARRGTRRPRRPGGRRLLARRARGG